MAGPLKKNFILFAASLPPQDINGPTHSENNSNLVNFPLFLLIPLPPHTHRYLSGFKFDLMKFGSRPAVLSWFDTRHRLRRIERHGRRLVTLFMGLALFLSLYSSYSIMFKILNQKFK